MDAKVLEMFRSIQGEGKYAGVRQVFVRFFECNIHCVWCDTPHSIGDTTRRYDTYSLEELLEKIRGLWDHCHSVSLTGGEPLLQKDFLKLLLPRLRENGVTSYLETNGICPEELKVVIDLVDIVAMDLKLPSSTGCEPYWREHEEFMRIARQKDLFLKAVISNQTTAEDFHKAVDLSASVDKDLIFFIQPNSFDIKDGVMEKCLAFQEIGLKKMTDVRVLPQTHRFMKLR